MDYRLSGHITMADHCAATMMGGHLALLSDGHSRSEIVVRDPESGQEERLVFSTGNSWRSVYHLINAMRRLYPSDDLEGLS